MEITLTKKVTYELQPFGKFVIKWNAKTDKPNVLPFHELRIMHDTQMPVAEEQDKEIIKLMKKNKTDILTDGEKFYTRIGIGFGEVWHKKLSMYRDDEGFRELVDNGKSF
jgi:hypothetical protein